MPTNFRLPLAILVLVASLLPLPASAQAPVTAEIYEFGLYALGPITAVEPSTEYGVPRLYGDQISLLEETHEVPGRLDVSFGVRFVVRGPPEGIPVPVTLVVRYPPQGLYNPERSGPSYFDEQTSLPLAGREAFLTWDFLEQWHIEPGIWNIEIWHDGEKLAEQWFEVITPPLS